MFNVTEYQQKSDRLADLLPWAALIRPGVILNKDGSFQRTLWYRGPDLASSTDHEWVSFVAKLNNVLKRLGSGWAMYVEADRYPAARYPEIGSFPDPVSWLVDLERRDLFEREKENYESAYYLTFQYLMPSEATSSLSKWFISKDKEQRIAEEAALDAFVAGTDRLIDILKDFLFEVRWLNDSETLTYLHQCVSLKRHPIQLPEIPAYLDGVLADCFLVGGLEPQLGEMHLSTISIMGFPATSVPGILDQLNHLALEYRWVTRFICLDKPDAERMLTRYKRRWFSKRKGMMTLLQESFTKSESQLSDSASIKKSWDADEALQSLSDDYVAFGFYTATVTIWDKDRSVLQEKRRAIERVINGLGFATIHETVNAVEAWLSSLPGHAYANVRMPLIHTLNLAHLIPFSAVWAGQERDVHLGQAPLMVARTVGNTPFRYVLHVGDVGHQIIIGPTGAGKSVLLNMMALQFLRYKDAQVFIFDKGQSFLASTLGVGGSFYVLGSHSEAQFRLQPLRHIDKPEVLSWANHWILGLLAEEGIELEALVKERVWDALTHLAQFPEDQRTVSSLKALLQDQKLRSALGRYTVSGPFGDLLDADTEKWSKSSWECFEMTEIMDMPAIVAPVLSYLFHQIEGRLDGRPTFIVLDEAWLFLEHPLFSAQINMWMKTLRKKNASLVIATQSVADLVKSPISSALLENCPSRIFLPNPRANEPAIKNGYEKVGMNEKEIQVISNAVPKRQYYYTSPVGRVLFELALGPISISFAGASSMDDRKLCHSLYAQYGKDEFLQAYLGSRSLDWAWDLVNKKE